MTLPHAYEDEDGNRLEVLQGYIVTTEPGDFDPEGPQTSVTAPKGADAVALAKAVLEAAGDTGHVVTSWREYHEALRNAREEGARSMRERTDSAARSAVVVDRPLTLAEQRAAIVTAIRALPLLPGA